MSLPTPTLPTIAGAFTISDSARSVTLPSTVNSDGEARVASTYSNRPDGFSGSVFRRSPAFEPVKLSLVGIIVDPTIIQDISRIIGSGRITVTRSSRTLVGDVVAWSLKEKVTGSVWDFSLEVESNQYYWQGASLASADDPATVTNSGDFPVYPLLTFIGGSGGATVLGVTINGGSATFTGSVGLGEFLIIDCERLTCTLDGVNALSGMNADFFTNPPSLNPGSNTVSISVTGTAPLTVEHTERYLS